MAGVGESVGASEETLVSSVGSPPTGSTTSIGSLQHGPPKSWQCFENTDVIKIQTGYAEYYVLNKDDEKLYTALLTYDERSCWFQWLCCCRSDIGFIPHEKLYPNPPVVSYKRHPLNICGFGVQIYDSEQNDVMRFHRKPHDMYDLTVDETMKISGPSGGLMGSVVVPREKGGDLYDVKDANGTVVFEVPVRVLDEEKRHVFHVLKVHHSGEKTPGARITIDGRHDMRISLTSIQKFQAGDFHIHYDPTLHPREKALLLATAFFVRIREFSGYIPMVEAAIAARAIIHDHSK